MSELPEQVVAESTGTRDRILLVDDDPSIRRLLRRLLERAGYDVLEAGDGDEAIDVVGESFVNLVITDMMMPRKTGMELLAHLNQNLPFVPVIIITAKPVVEAAVECIRNGAYDYISKPFDFAKIRECITRALEEHHDLMARETSGIMYNINYRRFFGDFRINRVLGEGNTGIVFQAQRSNDPESTQYALKILKPNKLGRYSTGTESERFLRTAAAIAAIKHPNLMQVVEYGLTGDEKIPFVVMEYFRGQTVKEFMDAGTTDLTYPQKTHILLQIAEGLRAIHDQAIAHRDIKPHNIMINDELQVKLMDFGIAQLPDSELTLTTEIIGSPAYLSPEGFDSAKVDHRADLFSLGVLAYELYLGRKPFDAKTIPQFSEMVRNHYPIEPRKLDKRFPEQLQNVLAMLLKKDPNIRCQSARQVVDAFNVFFDGSIGDDETAKCDRNAVQDWA